MRRTREIVGRTVAVRSTEVDLGVVLVASRSRRPARIDGLSVTMNAPGAAVPAPADIGLPVVLGARETTTVNVPGAVPTATDSRACRILAGAG